MCEKLIGSVKNTSFTIFDSTGQKQLVKPTRSPRMSFSGKLPTGAIAKIADKAGGKPSDGKTVLQDFHSLTQAMIASSADQRLLVVSVLGKHSCAEVQAAFNNDKIRGVVHFDQIKDLKQGGWQDLLKGNKATTGHFILRAEPYARFGTVLKELPLTVSSAQLVQAVEEANREFAASEKRKDYAEHVKQGLAQGIKVKTNVSREAVKEGKGRK